MVYRKGGGPTYYVRVIACSGVRRICSTGTTLKTSAKAVEDWASGVRNRLDPHHILDAIVAREIGLAEAYRMGEAEARAHLDAKAKAAADVDLKPLLPEWLAWRRQRQKGQSVLVHYEAQIKALWPEATWPRSQWTPQECARRLDGLKKVSDGTRNRRATE